MADVHVRVHTEFITQENLIEFLTTYCSRWYMARETDASRPHYQAFATFKPRYLNVESMRNQLKKRLNDRERDKGNKVYSISVARECMAQHIAYLMKEGQDPVSQEGISDDTLQTAQQLVKDFKRKQGMSTVQRLAYEYKGPINDVRAIGKYVIEESQKNGKLLPDMRLMKRYVESIQFYKDPKTYEAKYLDILENFFLSG